MILITIHDILVIQTKKGLMLEIQTVGAVSFNSQIFYFPMKLWVQMPRAAKLQKYDYAVCFKTQISAQPAAPNTHSQYKSANSKH